MATVSATESRSTPRPGRSTRGALRLIAAGALATGLLMLPQVAQARNAAGPSLDVTFFATGVISVALPDGTPVGSTSGAPTVIPAGYYTLLVSGPGGCTQLPLFYLSGPNENLNDDMSGGELNTEVYNVNLLPNSTYTWHTDRGPAAAIHTFTTSATVVGAAPTSGSSSSTATTSTTQVTPTSGDIVGSGIAPFRGALSGAVSTAGKLTLTYKGKSPATLPAGRYKLTIADRSSTNGFLLEKTKHGGISVTGAKFTGKRSLTVTLTAGKWFLTPSLTGKKSSAILVS